MGLGRTAGAMALIAWHLVACVPGVSASSPKAFTMAPGTLITLHMQNGQSISGEYSRHDARIVVLDSGSVTVARADVRTVEVGGSYEVGSSQVIDQYGHPSQGTKIKQPTPVVETVVHTIESNVHTR